MKTKEVVYFIIVFSGIVPATILFGFSFYIIFRFITDQIYQLSDFIGLFCVLMGMCGYIGLIRALFFKTKPLLTVLLLVLGLIGVSLIGGKSFWAGVFTIKASDDWLIGGYPMFVTIFAIVVNGYRFLKSRQRAE